uniref:tRNA nucleotidyltransferase/poly(A) polymerase n=1 Tax=Pithovirus LCPAC403 TaxID=2506596 RepID=A0A481ZBC5_9VIRU|nr:MAG: tRNA nucleotidyltransferase/poly(A) polymerase [Pithovirus LCPAC403]
MNRIINLTGFDKETFIKINNLGVIAGGSVVYALNEFVPKQSVGDVDIFVLNEDLGIFNKLRGIIRNATGNIPEESDDNYCEKINLTKVATFENPRGKPIQLILSTMKNPRELVNDFTLDYVRCYFHEGMFGVTESARQAHASKTVTLLDKNHDDIEIRIQKARKKGFEISDGEWEFTTFVR